MPPPPEFEKKLWDAADQLWTNAALMPNEYATPVLGLIFLKYADHKHGEVEAKLAGASRRRRGVTRRTSTRTRRSTSPMKRVSSDC